MEHSLGAFLDQDNDEIHVHAIYYLSRMMLGVESRYNPEEKKCLALVSQFKRCGITLWAKQSTEAPHNKANYPQWSLDHVSYAAVAVWHVVPSTKVNRKQAIADFLAENPESNWTKLLEGFTDKTAKAYLTHDTANPLI